LEYLQNIHFIFLGPISILILIAGSGLDHTVMIQLYGFGFGDDGFGFCLSS